MKKCLCALIALLLIFCTMPTLAEDAADAFQDPLVFMEGRGKLLSSMDDSYRNYRNYFTAGKDGKELTKAYVELCKSNSNFTYVGTIVSGGHTHYRFEPSQGRSYSLFTDIIGISPTICLSIQEGGDYGFIIEYSPDLKLEDLGYRFSTMPKAAAQSADLEKTWLSKDQYYYNQLSAAHKKAWDFDITNVLNYPEQTPSSARDVRHQALAPMIKADNPRIFWIDWIDSQGLLRYETGSTATYAPLTFPNGKTLSSLQETFLAAIPKAVAAIEKTLPANPTAADKARAIHDWLCKNNTYNEKQTSSHKKENDPVSFAYLAAHSAYSALIPLDTYKPVCEGYAGAFKILCEEFGLEAICVSGSTKEIANHMWNYVKLDDGQWYLVDVDADDLANSYVHTYFLLGQSKSAESGYTPNAYMGSGVNPDNGYTEGAAFTVPELAK